MRHQNTSPEIDNRPVFEQPSHYANGEVRMLKGFGNDKHWWLNIDYVESSEQPDFDVLRQLIRHRRESHQRGQ